MNKKTSNSTINYHCTNLNYYSQKKFNLANATLIFLEVNKIFQHLNFTRQTFNYLILTIKHKLRKSSSRFTRLTKTIH